MVANSSPIMNSAIGAAPEVRSNTRLLGLIGMVFSPCFLLMITTTSDPQDSLFRLGSFAGLLFTVGWFSNVLGLLQLRATGKRLPGKILLGVELVGVTLAAIFQVFEFTGLGAGSLAHTITDIAWPLSMLTLLIISITIAIIGGLRGAARFVPIIAPIWLPLSILAGITLGEQASLVISGIVATLGWFLTGYVIFQGGGLTRRA